MNTQRFVLLSVAISLVSLSASSAAEPFHLEWVWVETPFGKSVIDRGPVGEWDHAAVDNPYVYAEDGRFYCFFEAQDTKRSGWHERIGLAVSDDGVKWNKSPDNPVLDVGRKALGTVSWPSYPRVSSNGQIGTTCSTQVVITAISGRRRKRSAWRRPRA